VSLPHSSLAQYNMLPHLSRDQLAPGDLLFFYSPVSHVAIYTGNNMEIDASHPGTTVSEHAVYWDNFVAGGRPT
jgi:peptidoglycan DL-endopeptidase CwlO